MNKDRKDKKKEHYGHEIYVLICLSEIETGLRIWRWLSILQTKQFKLSSTERWNKHEVGSKMICTYTVYDTLCCTTFECV